MRADRDDAEYLELASRYDTAVSLGAAGGEGVLIGSRWVLTTSGRAKALQAMSPAPRLRFGKDQYAMQSAFVPPQLAPGGACDVGLILLGKAVTGVRATPLYRQGDEAGKGVVIVGHGASGKIGAKELARDGQARAAINTVDRVEPRTVGLRLKEGDEASDLQGAIAPDETGAPAYVETAAGLFVAGIAIGAGDEWQDYARVSACLPWIDGVILDTERAQLESALGTRGN